MDDADLEAPDGLTRRVGRVVIGVVLGVTTALAINARQPHDTAAGRPGPAPSVATDASPPETTVAPDSTTLATTTSPATTTTTSTTTTSTTTLPPPTTTTSTTLPTTTTSVAPGAAPPTVPGTTVPQWPAYEPLPPIVGRAALTGEPADESITLRPILAVKIENERGGRPQWGLESADAIFEENVESMTRFIALYQTNMPDRVGPVRSARTGDLDILAAMNRPVLAWSGGNPGVTKWVDSAASSGVVVNFTALRNKCYERSPTRRSPHNLLLDPLCAIYTATSAGRARPLWTTDADWKLPAGSTAVPDSTFVVKMDGLTVEWRWDAASGRYWRNQAGGPHLTVSGVQISANTVVELRTFHKPSPVDARTPHPITTGGTSAIIHRDGIRIEATWYRESPQGQFWFHDLATGAPIPLDTGQTFIQLVRDR
ncbi:MAG: DUF3048 domain-containing protein [Ilumatobacter sp.]|nr:DUF3048 domain-containing protein [Ilumatobacter sp.]